MLQNIKIDYPSYFILFCLLLGILFSVILYFRNRQWKDHPNWIIYLNSLLRTLGIASIAFLLLGPILERFIDRTEDPIIVIAKDRSSSLIEVGGMDNQLLIQDQIQAMEESLSENYEVESFSFGSKVNIEAQDSSYDSSTNISAALTYIDEQYADRNIGAIVLASDGIFNEGRNPIYENVEFTTPLHVIALGDTTIRTDLWIKNALYNKIAYLGDEAEIQIDVQAHSAKGQKSGLKLYEIIDNKKKLIKEEIVNITSDPFFNSYAFTIKTQKVGNVKYLAELSPIKNEISRSNNAKYLYIDVIDARQQILVLANGPHPDIMAMKQSLERNKNYELTIQYDSKKPINTSNTDVVVFHNLPSADWDITSTLFELDKKRIPRIFITGNKTDFARFNALDQGLKVSGSNGSTNDSEAKFSDRFNLYIVGEDVKNMLPIFPPLLSPFGQYDVDPSAKVMLSQTINSIETNYPLLVFDESKGIKKTIIAGEGFWKWRLFDFLQNNNHNAFESWLQSVLKFTTLKEDKRQFRVNISKKDIKVNEDVLFDAQLYNELFQLINGTDVSIQIKNSEGKRFDYQFSKFKDYYMLNAGSFAEGKYTWTAETNYNGKKLTADGGFVVKAIQKESYNLTADHQLLYQLSQKFGGKVYLPSEIESIAKTLTTSSSIKPVIYSEKDNKQLMDYLWLIIPILLMFFGEWFLRRYTGLY